MKITKKQVKQLDKGEVTVRELFPEVFQTKLEVGKWYKHKYIGYLFCFNGVYDDYSQYGIRNDGEWSVSISSHKSNLINIEPATEEEVKTALINKAKKRGFKKGVCVNARKYFGGLWYECSVMNSEKFEYTSWKNCIDQLCLGNYAIYKNGTWAEIIETITKEEAEKILNKKIV